MKTKLLLSSVLCLLSSVAASAALSSSDASRLGNDLTPLGGEKAGNADGSIPAFCPVASPPPRPDTRSVSTTLTRSRPTR